MQARIFYKNESVLEDHYYTDFKRLLQDNYRPLVTAMVLEVDEAGTPLTDRVLAVWNGFVKKALTDAQQKQLMSLALENYVEQKPVETPAFVQEGWRNLWEDLTPGSIKRDEED